MGHVRQFFAEWSLSVLATSSRRAFLWQGSKRGILLDRIAAVRTLLPLGKHQFLGSAYGFCCNAALRRNREVNLASTQSGVAKEPSL